MGKKILIRPDTQPVKIIVSEHAKQFRPKNPNYWRYRLH